MERSESISKLALALAKAQAQMKGAVKDSQNPFFKSNYADLESVWDACRKPLTDNELSVIQIPSGGKDALSVVTLLMHSSGEFISGELSLNPKALDPQGIGSALTYGRRYALAAFAGVYQTDDDGESAMDRRVEQGPKCEDCKRNVTGYTKPDGEAVPMQKVLSAGQQKFGKDLCGGCQIARVRREKQEAAPEPQKTETPAKKADDPGDCELLTTEEGENFARGTVTQIFKQMTGKPLNFRIGKLMFQCWHKKTLNPAIKEAEGKVIEVAFTVKDDYRTVDRILFVDGKAFADPLEIQESETVNASA